MNETNEDEGIRKLVRKLSKSNLLDQVLYLL